MFHIKALFFIMALYYALLGIIFAFIPASFFDLFAVTYPNHWGYVHVLGFTSFIWSLMSWNVSINPIKNRNLISYLALMHIFYTAGIFVDSGLFGMPTIWVYMAYASALNGLIYFAIYFLLGKVAFSDELAPKKIKGSKKVA